MSIDKPTSDDITENNTDDGKQLDTLGRPPEYLQDVTASFGVGIPGHRRTDAVRLIVPPAKLGEIDFSDTIDGALVQIINEVQPKNNVAEIDILMHPSPIGFVIVLHGVPRGIDERSIVQSTFQTFQAGVNQSVQNQLVNAAKKHTDRLGIETGTLNLDPVGISHVSTSRLLLNEDGQIGNVSKIGRNPLEKILRTLQDTAEPYIYEFIVGGGGGTDNYEGAVRLAPYNPEHTYTGDAGFAELVEKGTPVDLADVYGQLNLTSNHQLETENVLTTTFEERVDGSVNATVDYNFVTQNQYRTRYKIKKEADELQKLVCGKPEHVGLLNGNASYRVKKYKQYDKYGWFKINPAQLSLFAKCVPLRMEHNPWKPLDGRSAPEFDTEKVVRKVKHLKQSKGIGTINAAERQSQVANEGSGDHQALVEMSRRWTAEQGDTIKSVNQNTDTLPDLWLLTDDGLISSLNKYVDCEIVPVEAEYKNTSKPTGPLTNAERAYACDQHAIFIYDSKNKAKKGYEPLFTPYRGQTDFGIWLYSGDDTVTSSDGRTPVAEGSSDTTTAIWEIDATGRKRLRVSETELIFESDESLENGDYEYYYREVDNEHRIEDEDGNIVETYTGDAAFKANWTKITRPHHPADYHYGQNITVLYRDRSTQPGTEELKRYPCTPPWHEDFEAETGTIDKLQVVMDNFRDELVVEAEGEKLPYSDFQDQFRAYCEQWLSIEPPTNSVIGRVLPEKLKDAKKGGTDNRNPYFEGLAFCFPKNREVVDEIAAEVDVPSPEWFDDTE
jgi:hypothetical protein